MPGLFVVITYFFKTKTKTKIRAFNTKTKFQEAKTAINAMLWKSEPFNTGQISKVSYCKRIVKSQNTPHLSTVCCCNTNKLTGVIA